MARRQRRIRRQPPVQGGRDPLPSCVVHAIREEVTRLAVRHGVSRSWVVAKILGNALGIDVPEY